MEIRTELAHNNKLNGEEFVIIWCLVSRFMKINYRSHTSSSLGPIHGQLNPVLMFTFDTSLKPVLLFHLYQGLQINLFHLGLQLEKCLDRFLVFYMSYQSQFPPFDLHKNVFCDSIDVILSVHCFFPLRSKYSPHRPILLFHILLAGRDNIEDNNTKGIYNHPLSGM
jgi:hypothetical protein